MRGESMWTGQLGKGLPLFEEGVWNVYVESF